MGRVRVFSVICLSLILAGSSNLFGERFFSWSVISLRSHQLVRAFLVKAVFLRMPQNEIYEEMEKIFEEIQKIFAEMQTTYEEMQKTEVSCLEQAVAAWPEALAPGPGTQW